MAKFDLEDFRDYFLNLIKDNLDAKIDELNAEKADSITLAKPDASHFIHKVNDQALAFDPFIHYGFSDIKADSQAASVQWTPRMFFAFYFIDRDGGVAENKLLRYTRAMTEIIAANVTNNAMISTVKIIPLPPAIVSFGDLDGADYQAGGIEIEGSLFT
jgi:hypothetical protein